MLKENNLTTAGILQVPWHNIYASELNSRQIKAPITDNPIGSIGFFPTHRDNPIQQTFVYILFIFYINIITLVCIKALLSSFENGNMLEQAWPGVLKLCLAAWQMGICSFSSSKSNPGKMEERERERFIGIRETCLFPLEQEDTG